MLRTLLLLGLLLMPDPTNTTIDTALDLGATLPVTYGPEDMWSSGGMVYLWFKQVIPAGVNEIGPWVYGNFTTHTPALTVWRGPTSSPTQIGVTYRSVPAQIPVTPGETIYFRAEGFALVPMTLDTFIDIQPGPNLAIPAGSILINDSSPDYPMVAVSVDDGTVLGFRHPFPASESVKGMRTGQVMTGDPFGGNAPLIYVIEDGELVLQYSPVMPDTRYGEYIGTDLTTGWWAGRKVGAGHPTVVFVDKFGVVSGTVYDLGAGNLKDLTPSLDNAKLYFIRNVSSTNQPILVFDVATQTVSTFVAGVANYVLQLGMTTLLDGSILVGYERTGVANEVRRFNAAGVLLDTYSLGATYSIEQVFTAYEPDRFRVWVQPDNQFARFLEIDVATGAVIFDVESTKFVEGKYQGAMSATPSARFGTDFSCVPVTPMFSLTGGGGGGGGGGDAAGAALCLSGPPLMACVDDTHAPSIGCIDATARVAQAASWDALDPNARRIGLLNPDVQP